jgi:deoxyribodipyrimidine photo-lyase
VSKRAAAASADEFVDDDNNNDDNNDDDEQVTSKKAKKATSVSNSKGSTIFSGLRVRPHPSAALVDARRVRSLLRATSPLAAAPVVLWVSRDQRLDDNWAFLRAVELANATNEAGERAELHVAFCLARSFPDATWRACTFMLSGLEELATQCAKHGLPFHLLQGDVGVELPALVRRLGAGHVVVDFSPLRVGRQWRSDLCAALKPLGTVAVDEVDAHNIVPVWRASDKQEWAARTLRLKFGKGLLADYLTEFPSVEAALAGGSRKPATHAPAPIDWAAVRAWVQADASVGAVDWLRAGPAAASEALRAFLTRPRLDHYADRNDPTVADGQSHLSPFLHFGHLSPQRATIAALEKRALKPDAVDSFLEELVVRRELSDNFCYYNVKYDSFDGGPDWAKKSLTEHLRDPRQHLYTYEQLQDSKTSDALWNAAQMQLVRQGKMAGFLRMYWAKKVAEWTKTPQEAIEHLIKLNDRFSLDGRDPNGYVGIMWSVVGTHDQGWAERAVTGKVRCMTLSGCERKFDVPRFIEMVKKLKK